MPTYQYACTECGHTFEQVQSFHEDALTHCPECNGRLRKVFNAVGVVFKGSGFYRTDSRAGAGSKDGDGAKESAGSTKPADSASSSGSSGSSSGSGSSGSGSSGSGSSPSGSSTTAAS
ncbi:MAG: zinc ribbon domain-containing protein [Nocardioides sp.]|uniref:FmdB family zinc ribbon protein n=1 Tax=Nocardioides sp. TaxID=35761 RepID=UPI0039E5F97A